MYTNTRRVQLVGRCGTPSRGLRNWNLLGATGVFSSASGATIGGKASPSITMALVPKVMGKSTLLA